MGHSAGFLRAVPDTVTKVPGLAPVLFFMFFELLAAQLLNLRINIKTTLLFDSRSRCQDSFSLLFDNFLDKSKVG